MSPCLGHAGCPCPAHHALPVPRAEAFGRAARWTTEEQALLDELRDRAETRAAARSFLRALKKQGARLGLLALEALAQVAVSRALAELEERKGKAKP